MSDEYLTLPGALVDDDTRWYVGDLIRTAEDHHQRAVALLEEAARLLGQ